MIWRSQCANRVILWFSDLVAKSSFSIFWRVEIFFRKKINVVKISTTKFFFQKKNSTLKIFRKLDFRDFTKIVDELQNPWSEWTSSEDFRVNPEIGFSNILGGRNYFLKRFFFSTHEYYNIILSEKNRTPQNIKRGDCEKIVICANDAFQPWIYQFHPIVIKIMGISEWRLWSGSREYPKCRRKWNFP